ncbi:MAG: CIA30 family protein [Marinilabiliaceae bacterium]|nr:CIA30 family protein [Marinilabiliaceae bacterium]
MRKLNAMMYVMVLGALFSWAQVRAQQAKPVPEGFCFSENTTFYINKASGVEPYFYAGTNNYYVMYKPITMVTDILDDMVDLDLKVLRMWFFMDGSKVNDGHNIQTAPGVYNENTLKHIDEIVYEASKRDLKIVPVFINYWSDFGGMPQYAQWAGASATDFYSNSTCKTYYKNYVSMWLNRTNTKSGKKYKDDPTIFAWQLTNEARSTRQTVTDFVDWAAEMSAYIRSIDPYHMICMGDEGLMNYTYDEARNNPEITTDWTYTNGEGDYAALLDVPNLDYATFHNYATDNWSKDLEWGLAWTRHHVSVAHAKNKPCVMEEYDYGYTGSWTTTFDQTRAANYKQYTDLIEDLNMAGDHSWMLIGMNYWDPLENGYTLDKTQPVDKLWLYRVKWSDGHQYSKYDTYTAAVIKQHAQNMLNKNILEVPGAVSLSSPTQQESNVSVNRVFTWEAASWATSYRLVVSPNQDLSNPIALVDDISGNVCLVKSMQFNTTYYWQVVAVNVKGSTASQVRSFVTQSTPEPVGTFSLLKPSSNNVSIEQTSFQWTDAANADYYQLEVSTNTNLSSPVINQEGIGATSYISDVKLERATKYYYRLKAVNSLSEQTLTGEFTTSLYDGLIDDFNAYANCSAMQAAWVRNTGGESIAVCPSTNNAVTGNSMNIEYSFSNGGYCGVTMTKSLNLSGYEGISMILTPDGSDNELIIQLRESSDEYWEGRVNLTGTYTRRVFIPFSSFSKPNWNSAGNGVINLDAIINEAIYLGGSGGSNLSFQIDDLKADFEQSSNDIAQPTSTVPLMSVFPNPVIDVMNVTFHSMTAQAVHVTVYSANGVKMLQREMQATAGMNELSFDVISEGLRKGLYFVTVTGNNLSETSKVIVR